MFKEPKTLDEVLTIYQAFIYNVECDLGGWKEYRKDIGAGIEDNYPKSKEDFVRLIEKVNK